MRMSEKELERMHKTWKEILRRRGKFRVHFPKNPVKFFKEVLQAETYPYQSDFLLDPAPLKVIRWCRRAGKTFTMTGSDIYFAAHHIGARIIATMPKADQIKKIYFQSEAGLHAHIERMPQKYRDALVQEVLQTIVRFNTGCHVFAETPEPFTIRGHGPSKLNIDEMNFIRRDRDLWLSALLPMTLTKIVYINVASTPWNEDSIYHQMCFDENFDMFSGNLHESKPDPPRYLKTWRQVLKPNGPLDPRQVEMMRKQYAGDPWRWRREMECEFVSDETAFLPSSLIVKCQNADLDFARFEDLVEGELYGGWDLGRERDPGVVAVIDKQGDVRSLVHCHQFPLGTPYVAQMGYIQSLCQRWRWFRNVFYDHTGTKGIDEEIEKLHLPGCVGIDFSKPRKHGMATLLKDLMMSPREEDKGMRLEDARRRFEMPYDQDVQSELNCVQWEQSPGSDLYTFSHPESSHDDRFWSICLAVLAAAGTPGQLEVARGRVPR